MIIIFINKYCFRKATQSNDQRRRNTDLFAFENISQT